MRKGKHGIPRFCAFMYIAINMHLLLIFCLLPLCPPCPHASSTNVHHQPSIARTRLFGTVVSVALSFCRSACARLSLFFSLNLTPTLQNPYPFPSFPWPPPISNPQSPSPDLIDSVGVQLLSYYWLLCFCFACLLLLLALLRFALLLFVFLSHFWFVAFHLPRSLFFCINSILTSQWTTLQSLHKCERLQRAGAASNVGKS